MSTYKRDNIVYLQGSSTDLFHAERLVFWGGFTHPEVQNEIHSGLESRKEQITCLDTRY